MKKQYLLIGAILLLSACSSSTQYDVYVKNSTNEPLTVVYKSGVDKNSNKEQSIVLKQNENKRIISTGEIDNTITKEGAKSCEKIAEFVTAYKNKRPANLQWCDEEIQYSVTDIGQREFFMEFTNEDF